MKVAQTYKQGSQSNISSSGLGFSLATDLNRPGVFLSAQVKDGMSFARSMLVLHRIVNSNMIKNSPVSLSYLRSGPAHATYMIILPFFFKDLFKLINSFLGFSQC